MARGSGIVARPQFDEYARGLGRFRLGVISILQGRLSVVWLSFVAGCQPYFQPRKVSLARYG
jgi:hypothetical protein